MKSERGYLEIFLNTLLTLLCLGFILYLENNLNSCLEGGGADGVCGNI